MALPGDLNTVIVTGNITDAAGNPARGSVSFCPNVQLSDMTSKVTIPQFTRTYALTGGAFRTDPLVATDSANITPQGWAYDVTISLQSGRQSLTVFLPHTISPADLSQLVPATAPPALASYLPASGGVLAGTLTLDGTPPLALPSGSSGYVLTSDGSGHLTLQPGASGSVASVNGQTGTVVLTAASVGADTSGAASGAQAAAETFATSAVGTETARAETAEALALAKSANLSDLASAPSARTNLGLGSAALSSTSAFDAAGAASAAQGSAETFATSAVATETSRAEAAEALAAQKAANLSDLASAGTARTNLGLGTAATQASSAFDAAGTATSAVAAETSRAETAEALLLPLAGGTMSGPIAMGSSKVTGLANGSASSDAAAFGQIPAALPPSGTAGGVLTGTYPNPGISTLNQNTSGTAAGLSSTLALTSGGTGQTSAQAAMDSLAGAQTSGSYLRGNGTHVVMAAISASDVPTLNQNTSGNAANITGTLDTVPAPVANVSLNSHKVTSLLAGTASTDGANTGQVPLLSGANVALYLAPSGATGVTFDRAMASNPSAPANAGGTLYVRAIALPSGLAVNNITFLTAGTAQITGTHGWYVLLDSSRVVRAVSADQTSTVWSATNTAYTLSVSGSAYTTTYSGLYYVGFATVSATNPVFAGGVTTSSTYTNLPPILMGTSSASQTTPPLAGATMGAIAGNAGFNFLAWTS